MRTLDTGAALGAASLVLSSVALMHGNAPSIAKVRNAEPGSGVASDLRLAELTSAAWVVGAGAIGAVLVRKTWPLMLSVAAVGLAVAVYEVNLHLRDRRDSAAA
jgi:hypothetical protein